LLSGISLRAFWVSTASIAFCLISIAALALALAVAAFLDLALALAAADLDLALPPAASFGLFSSSPSP